MVLERTRTSQATLRRDAVEGTSLAFSWIAYATLADALWDDDKYEREPRHRAAAGRYYYAAHWRVREFLEQNCSSRFGTVDVHTAVVDECRRSTSVALRTLGENLMRLKQKRLHADYDNYAGFLDIDMGCTRRFYANVDSALRGLLSGTTQ